MLKFWMHVLSVVIFVDMPLWGINPLLGFMFLPVLIGFVELIHIDTLLFDA